MLKLVRKVAVTKMSEVWEGYLNGIHVAVKKPVEQDMLPLLRFVKEAKYWKEISDLNIEGVARVVDINEEEPWFAVEFVNGELLERKLKNADVREIMRRMLEVLRIIHLVHEKGYLHLDIKPSNILIDGFGDLVIIDWGLAARLFRKLKDDKYTFIGTPSYAPPEMWDPDKYGIPDERSDIYEIGTTFYKILTRQIPFSRKTEVLQGKIKPFPTSVPKPVRRIILKAMHLDMDKRYSTAMEMYKDVQRWLGKEYVLQRGIYKIRFKKSLSIYYDHSLNFVADPELQKKPKVPFGHLAEQSREKRKIAVINGKKITSYRDNIFVDYGFRRRVKPVSSAELYHGSSVYYRKEEVGVMDYGSRNVIYADFISTNVDVGKMYFSLINLLKENGLKVKTKRGKDKINIVAHKLLLRNEPPGDYVIDNVVFLNRRRIHMRLVPDVPLDSDIQIKEVNEDERGIFKNILRCVV